MSTHFAFAALLLMPWSIPSLATAEDPPTADIKPGDTGVDNAALQDLVKQLDAKKKDDREAAAAKLQQVGAAAIPALADGALGGKRETILRAIEILKGHAQGADAAAKQAAIDALNKVANGKSPIAAKRAKEALQGVGAGGNLQFGGGVGRGFGGGGFGGFGQFGPGGAGTGEGKGQFQIHLESADGRSPKLYKMRCNGDVRDIEVEDKGRTIKIHHDPKQGIVVEITEIKDGQPVTRKVEAKDLADLKEKDADAAKDFEQWSKPPNGFQFGFGGGGGAFPGFPGGIPGGAQGGDLRQALEAQIKQAEGQLEALKKDDAIPLPEKKIQIDQLQAGLKQIRTNLKNLPKGP